MIDWETPLPSWKQFALIAMTMTVVAAAHWHSFVAARRDVRARGLPTRRQVVLSYLWRHQLHYARQAPMIVAFVLASAIVVATL